MLKTVASGGGGGGGNVSGTGTANYVVKWATSSTIGNSIIYDDGTTVTVGGTSISYPFGVKTATNSYGIAHNDGTHTFATYLDTNGVWVGSDSNDSLILMQNGNEAMRINTALNVGIGVVNPTKKLDVAGEIKTTGGVLPRVIQSTIYTSWNSSTADLISITAQTGAMTVGADLGGSTAVNGQKIVFRIVGGAGGCTVTFDSGANYKFKGIGVTLPSATAVASGATMMLGAIYNTNSLLWEVVALTQG